MNLIHRTATRLAIVVAGALFCVACETTASDQGTATAKNITKAADSIQAGIGHLDATLASLNALVNQPAADLGPQFKTFSKNLDSLDSTATDVREATAGMEQKGAAYFAEWDKQIAAITNEDIRERSMERRKEVEANLADLRKDYTEARDTFQPLMSDLKDIHTALSADLTMQGVDAVKKSVKKVNDEAPDVKENLEEVSASFRELGVRMSKSGPPPAQPK